MPKQTIKKPKQPNKIKARINGYIAVGRARANTYLAARPHRSFRPTPRARYKRGNKVEGVWRLIIGTFKLLWQEKRLMGVLLLLFALVTFVFVGAVEQAKFIDLRQTVHNVFSGNLGELGSATALFSAALTGSLNPALGELQQFLAGLITFIFWLAMVWVLRRRMSGQPTSIREALYNSGAPIVPSALILVVIFLQLIPAAIGLFGAGVVLSGLWLQGVEGMVITVGALLMCLLSLYWVSASFVALIIVAIPGMYPYRAHAAASALVIGQRWRIALRLVALVAVSFVVWLVVLVPTLLLDGWLKFNWLPLIPFVVQLLAAFTLTYVVTYIYKMYRSMI